MTKLWTCRKKKTIRFWLLQSNRIVIVNNNETMQEQLKKTSKCLLKQKTNMCALHCRSGVSVLCIWMCTDFKSLSHLRPTRCTHSCGAPCLQAPDGKVWPTRRSSRITRSRPGSAGSTSSATPTTSTSPDPKGPASWRAAGWGWASTRPWWRAAGRSREWPTHTGAAAHFLAHAAALTHTFTFSQGTHERPQGAFFPFWFWLRFFFTVLHTFVHSVSVAYPHNLLHTLSLKHLV